MIHSLVTEIGRALALDGFTAIEQPPLPELGVSGFWTLRTWNYNRAVVLVNAPVDSGDPGAFCQRLKWRVLWRTRFIPFLYELGLQIVVVGDDLIDDVDAVGKVARSVDKISNQFVTLQGIFLVDVGRALFVSARSPGLSLTRAFQDSIEAGIRLAGIAPAGGAPR